MLTLKQLQELGSLSSMYEVVKHKAAIALSDFQQLSDQEKVQNEAPVVLDNCVWAATKQRMPITKADTVMSYDGTVFGRWSKSEHTFTKLVLEQNKLSAISRIKADKEEKRMAEMNVDLGAGLVDEIQNELAHLDGNPGTGTGGVDKINAFDNVDNSNEKSAEVDEKKAKKEAKERELRADIDRIKRSGDQGRKLNSQAIVFNHEHARCLGFICATDSTIKPRLTRTPLHDVHGNTILVPNAPAEEKSKFEAGKKVKNTFLECEATLNFYNTKPSTPKGMIIKIPAMTLINPDGSMDDMKFDLPKDPSQIVYQIQVVGMETAYTLLASSCGGWIKEDDTIIGAKAGALQTIIKSDPVDNTNKGGTREQRLRTRLVIEKNEHSRKSLLIPGNYFPANTFKTASVATASAEEKAAMDRNFSNLLKTFDNSKTKATTKLADGVLGPNCAITVDDSASDPTKGDYKVTSKFVDGGEPIKVTAFYDKETPISDVRLPLLNRTLTKDNAKVMYPYIKFNLDSEEGPLYDPRFADFIKNTGLSKEEFRDKVKSIISSRRSNKDNRSLEIDSLTYYQYKSASGSYADGSMSIVEVAEALKSGITL